ncbi:methyl-accepting chemotaxis protein [Bradyrhizobium aeschynomenes]|uniref:methyl-accepting chemotaxis protein n=1 Tax=Bradyrhizobium aeschynomenes TaxID=2734909 RepID=UPI001FEE358F|nr:methyl-accepting chemotaxis protein [Bradyrhizobium aeschynomenes]
MFGWKNSNAAAAKLPSPEPSDVPAPEGPQRQDELMRRWIAFADMQQRVIRTLVHEIQQTSAVVETEADNLSSRFQNLAICAGQQTERVESLSRLAIGIEVDGEAVAIDRIAVLLEETLSDVVEKILMLSKDAMSMVYALSELSANVDRVDSCMEELNKINRVTNMLALNARIEAERAGTAGAAFRVVAGEVRELSGATQRLSVDMATELKAVTEGIADGHATLQRVATIDLSQNLMAKDRLQVLMEALIRRSGNLTEVVADAMKEAEVISADVAGMVTGIQFQDRTRQRLEHVVDTLRVVDEALDELKTTTAETLDVPVAETPGDNEWVKTMLDRFTLGDMRSRFVAQILEGRQPADHVEAVAAPSTTGTVELF